MSEDQGIPPNAGSGLNTGRLTQWMLMLTFHDIYVEFQLVTTMLFFFSFTVDTVRQKHVQIEAMSAEKGKMS